MVAETTTKQLRIILIGGGSGGHITPLLAVAHQLKLQQPDCELVYIGQRGDSLADVPAADPNIDATYSVRAGKLRRYHGEGLKQLLDVPTMAKNFRDVFYVAVGIVQSYRLLRRLRPQVVFVKGGFVGVPVGLAAASLGIPYVTHDSDAIPGLANRIIARWAALHTVALPSESYPYPSERTVTVGVPVSHNYTLVDAEARHSIKQRLGLPPISRIILVTGGGLGAKRLNDAVIQSSATLLEQYRDLYIVHLAGRALEAEVQQAYDTRIPAVDRHRVISHAFVSNLFDFSAVADVIVTRAGGTSIAEFAAQAKACVVVPNPQLTGGHQTKNAKALAKLEAAVVVEEAALQADPTMLRNAITGLLDDAPRAQQLGARLHDVAKPEAAKALADILLKQAAVSSQ